MTNRWDLARLKDHVTLINGYPFDSSGFNPTAGTPLIRIRDLLGGSTETYFDGDVPPEVMVRSGDLVVGMDGDFNAVTWTGEPAALNQRLCLLRAKPSLDQRYMAYLIPIPLQSINDVTYATTVKHLSSLDLLAERIPLPPIETQRAIADYLDRETARIDALIEKKRRTLDLLHERRQAVIDATLQDSGPMIQIRHLVSHLTSGPRGWASFVSEVGTSFIRITNIQRSDIELDMSDTVLVQAPASPEANRTVIRAGDVLVSITADIGSVGIARMEHVGANISQHIALLRPTGCHPEWLAFAIMATPAQVQLDAGQYGGTKTQLSLDDIRGLRVPVPTEDRQQRLLTVIAQSKRSLDAAATLLADQIKLLAEHRQALITAAVTGELDIPGVAA